MTTRYRRFWIFICWPVGPVPSLRELQAAPVLLPGIRQVLNLEQCAAALHFTGPCHASVPRPRLSCWRRWPSSGLFGKLVRVGLKHWFEPRDWLSDQFFSTEVSGYSRTKVGLPHDSHARLQIKLVPYTAIEVLSVFHETV